MMIEKPLALDKQTFKNLFDLYFDDVRRYILYRCGNGEVATDIAQDTFLRIWEKAMIVNPETARGLLFKMAGDLYVTQYRREKLSFDFFKTFQPAGKSRTPEDELSYRELAKAYEKALKTMPEKQRTVFLMNRIDNLKYQEIADSLGLSVKAIEKRMSQALEHLRENLKENSVGFILFLAGLYSPNAKNITTK